MPISFIRNLSSQRFIIFIFAELIFLNLAWNHSYLGEKLIQVERYYTFQELPIFQYRALPSLAYCLISFGCHAREFAVNPPFHSAYSVFQVFWDFVALNLSFFAIHKLFFRTKAEQDEIRFLLISIGLVVWIVAFSFFFVPNRALFYSYDFSDFAFLISLAALSMRPTRKANVIACVVIAIGAFNKETVLIFPFVYFILRLADSRFTHALAIAALSFICGLIGKYAAIMFGNGMMQAPTQVEYAANQLIENIRQLKNPLFYFSFTNATAFLYIAIIAIRRDLKLADWALLLLAAAVLVGLFITGISRELRIYIPVTTLFLIILARHRDAVFNLFRRAT